MVGEELAARLKQLRKEHGMNRKQLSEAIGIPYATIDNYESGRSSVPMEFAISLAKLYGTTVDDVLGIEEEPAQDNKPGQVSFMELFNFLKDCGLVSENRTLSDADTRFLISMIASFRQWFQN